MHNLSLRQNPQNGPANMALMRHSAINIFKQVGDTASLKIRRKTAAWDDSYLKAAIKGEG